MDSAAKRSARASMDQPPRPRPMSVDDLITRLTRLNIDHQEVKVKMHVDGKTHFVTDFHFGISGLSLILTGEE